ncbi:MAG: P-loop NTPase [Candidatus Altiarchaeia archaeon]
MIIAIASGKGGTGKTTVAVNLVLSLSSCVLADCDVEEPNANLFLGIPAEEKEDVTIPYPVVDASKCVLCSKCAKLCQYHALAVLKDSVMVFKELCHGCGLCAMACPQDAITEEERVIGTISSGRADSLTFLEGLLNIGEAMATPIIKKLKEKAGNEGKIILDSPPGTSCPAVETISCADYCILVTEPTLFGLHDLGMALDLCNTLKVPCGVVVNRDGAGGEDIDGYCKERQVQILMRIPFERKIAELYAKGVPFAKEMPEWREKFNELYERIIEEKKDIERIARRRSILDVSGIKGGTFLDVGAGPLGVIAAKEYNCIVTAIDTSAEKIEQVREAAAKAGVSIKFDLGDASRMSYPDSSFDSVACLGTLHHVPLELRPLVVRECFRAAKDRCVIAEYTKKGFEKIHPDGAYLGVDLVWLEKEIASLGSAEKKRCGDLNVYVLRKKK